ncbi:MAG: Eco57I restriction-modification methylase domain-containing protein [Proteobacteria bacterium]|nr:Eco57I restriction-modification methylase domain-containing protein [Pseudomonadota bacterium]MBU4471113.1 Eco57I restriction-modification methylase domain-containing protein [Pseudomonadota bacterium]
MAGMFSKSEGETCRLLDAGAGIGSLSAAFLKKWETGDFDFKNVELDAVEIDETLLPQLEQTFEIYGKCNNFSYIIRNIDFIEAAVDSLRGSLFSETLPKYTHAILNPPYRKIGSNSRHRTALRQIGLETVNLYSAFVALSLALLEKNGELVAIIPRSFCNGPYYLPFRKFIMLRSAIRKIHLFKSRAKAFKDDNVLQENVILKMERGGRQGDVEISTSTDDTFIDIQTISHPFNSIICPKDPHFFIHIPTSLKKNLIQQSGSITRSLDDIGIMVSTGPVVDFRLKEFLRDDPETDTVPLLYPGHFNDNKMDWPKPGFKKPNAIKWNEKTEKWLYPNGHYCVVRRFSSKEEKRRIVSCVVNPDRFKDMQMLGFENHLNVFHDKRAGLPKLVAYGLATYLNSTAVDENFRKFNGHTQVNATDLRSIKYPKRETLMALGEWFINIDGQPTQDLIDEQLKKMDK